MKQRHHCQQSVACREPEPLANLPRICNHVSVSQQAALWLSRGARCIDDDCFVVSVDLRGRQVAGGPEFKSSGGLVVKWDYRTQMREFGPDTIDTGLKLRVDQHCLGF